MQIFAAFPCRLFLARLALCALVAAGAPAAADDDAPSGPADGNADVADAIAADLTPAPPTTDQSVAAEQDEVEIRARLAEWSQAFADRNGAAACDLFAADVVAEIEDGPTLDHAGICRKISDLLDGDDVRLTYTPSIDEVLPLVGHALVRVTWTLAIDRNGEMSTSRERGFDLFRKDPDGKWRIIRYLSYPIE